VCENGFGKRTPFGPPELGDDAEEEESVESGATESEATEAGEGAEPEVEGIAAGEPPRSSTCYRRQRRGGKGLRNIKTTDRNGKVIDVTAVSEQDELLMVTAGGIIQRIRASDVSRIGRNTQ